MNGDETRLRPARWRGLRDSDIVPMTWSLGGTAVFALSQFAVLVVLVRVGSSEMAGVYAAALAIVAPVFMFANLQLRQVVATDVRGEHSPQSCAAVRMLSMATALVVAGIIALAFEGPSEIWVVTLGVAMLKAIEGGCDLFYGEAQRRMNFRYIGLSQLLRGVTTLGVLAALLTTGASLVVALLGSAAASIAIFLLYDVTTIRPSSSALSLFRLSGVDAASVASLLRVGIPLGLVMGFASLAENAPRYVLRGHLGLASIGIFSALMYVVLPGRFLVTSLGQLAIVRFARQYDAGDGSGMRGTLGGLIGISVALGTGAFVVVGAVGGDLLRVIYGEEFRQYTPTLQVLVVAMTLAWANGAAGQALTAARIVDGQLFVAIGTAAAVFAALLQAVPSHGLTGAAYAIVVGYVVQSCLFGLLLYRNRHVFAATAPLTPVSTPAT